MCFSFNNNQAIMSLLNNSNHSKHTTSHNKDCSLPQRPSLLINPLYLHRKHSSTTQLPTSHRHPNHQPCLSHLSIRQLLARPLTTVVHHNHHPLLTSLHGPNHLQYQCTSLSPPTLCQPRYQLLDSMVLRCRWKVSSLQCRFSIQEVQWLLGHLILAHPLQGPLQSVLHQQGQQHPLHQALLQLVW